MSRTKARELVFLTLFSLPHSTDLETVLHSTDHLPEGEVNYRKLTKKDREFFHLLLSSILAEWKLFPEILGPVVEKATSKKWQWNRIRKVEQILLIIAYFELFRLKQPPAVVVDAVLDLAHKYGEEDAPSFLHGLISEMQNYFSEKEEISSSGNATVQM
ncbi:MAG: transcription antitermination factor NusB [bacterium JZ-2024 1]